MTVEITIRRADGSIVYQLAMDALRPQEWRTNPDHPEVEGDYRYYGYTYQPRVVLASKAGGF